MTQETDFAAFMSAADIFPGAKAHVGVSVGNIVIRWGPYEPEQRRSGS